MAKRKSTKKEKEVVEEVLEVKFSDIEDKVEENEISIEPIDMTEEIKEIEKEIFEEKKVEEKPIEEKKVENNKFHNKVNKMFGFIWNGIEFD